MVWLKKREKRGELPSLNFFALLTSFYLGSSKRIIVRASSPPPLAQHIPLTRPPCLSLFTCQPPLQTANW